MTRPRHVMPRQFHMLTRRCTQRQFLLQPGDQTNNIYAYCLAEAAQRFEMEIILPIAESNHHHVVLFDRHGRYPQFMEHLHKMLARCLNARWGRWENLWSSEEPCVTRLLDVETVMDKLVYAATNPVKDLLVERAFQWPGINGYRNLVHGKPLRAKRPTHFFRDGGVMPAEVELSLVVPPELGERKAVIAELQRRVAEVERATAEARRKERKDIVGRRAILQQSWKARPSSTEPRRNLRPRFAGAREVRVPALIAYREFLASYADARERWLAKRRVEFPAGTYWLARFAPISTATPPANT